MKKGNVTGSVYERSIHRKLKTQNQKDGKGAARGEDCAFFAFHADRGQNMLVTAAQSQTAYTGEDGGKYAVYAAVNQALATPVSGVLLQLLLPAEAEEQTLQQLVTAAAAAAEQLGVALADVKASVTAAVSQPMVTALAIGAAAGKDGAEKADAEKADAKKAGAETDNRMTAGSQIVMTKWAGLEGTAMLADRCRTKLRERYPAGLLEEAAGFDRYLSIAREAAVAVKSGCSMVCAAAEGGIFRALWTLAERAVVGLEVDLKKIPIRQETVEICNYLDLNPYELAANGSLLCITEHGETLVSRLQDAGIPAAVIGRVTDANGRMIRNGEECRYLEPAKEDELYKIF